jgi:hypothetical protein
MTLGVAAGLALSMGVRADTLVYNFTQTFTLTASPTGALPQINTTWNIPKYNGFGGLLSLTQVRYDVSTQISYAGDLVSPLASQTFNLQVRSAFNVDLPGTTPDVTTLNPVISLTGLTTGTAFNPLSISPVTSAANGVTLFASDLVAYVGSGTLSAPATGSLVSSALGGYNNTSDIGVTSPYVFVNNAKVFPQFGLQQYSLTATMTVTYTVPEATTFAAVGFLGMAACVPWIRHARRRGTPKAPVC